MRLDERITESGTPSIPNVIGTMVTIREQTDADRRMVWVDLNVPYGFKVHTYSEHGNLIELTSEESAKIEKLRAYYESGGDCSLDAVRRLLES